MTAMKEKYEVVTAIFHGFDYARFMSGRAKLRTMVKRILRKHGYPPDKQEKATQTVLAQAELLCKDWVA